MPRTYEYRLLGGSYGYPTWKRPQATPQVYSINYPYQVARPQATAQVYSIKYPYQAVTSALNALSPTWKRPQATTQVYLGPAMIKMMYAIRNFLTEVPFVTPKLLNTIPFIPPVSDNTPIKKFTNGGTNGDFNAAFK